VLETIATWKFPHSLPRSGQHAVTEGILEQTDDFWFPENEMYKLALMWEMTWSVHYHVLSHEFIFSFIFLPIIPPGRVVGPAALWGLEISYDQQQPQMVLLAQHLRRDKGKSWNHSTWSLGNLLTAFLWI